MAFFPSCRTRSTALAAAAAFRSTLPILVGFGFCGFSYGLYMHSLGFAPIVPVLMAAVILAGSLEFIMASMLTGPFAPFTAFTVGLVVNARHLFYGIAMLESYRDTKAFRPYLIYALIDETFSILASEPLPQGVDRHRYFFFVTLFNQCYWVFSTAIGAYFGSALPFSTEGMEFVLPALFLAIFTGSWQRETRHAPFLAGIGLTLLCLLVFGEEYFLLPSMALIVVFLLLFRKKLSFPAGGQA
ncbi:AzlC family ABC transporter permease [Mailhella massiliensis]|uniref:AzlC family ABC transporter permease n=1 Tax=Mailhella massiliensis TaxID=1903261 RepID=A0A921DSC4_9BACT|nr:AzlC family ABC transporter permease [Mailhella massiliensis]HJD97986.1 AzlC family ABC transporter permease [Mailhella massiliensis]